MILKSLKKESEVVEQDEKCINIGKHVKAEVKFDMFKENQNKEKNNVCIIGKLGVGRCIKLNEKKKEYGELKDLDYFIEENLYLKFMNNEDQIIRDYIVKIHKHHNTIDTITQIENIYDFKINDNSLFWTIVYENRVIGFFNFIQRKQPIDNTIELQRFYIDEEYRNLCIGSKVMLKVKEIAKSMKYSGISLKVYCNNQAINFHNKNGFDTYYRYMYMKLYKGE